MTAPTVAATATAGSELADRLLAAAAELTDRVLGEMYRDPFWYERFGEPRASRHGQQDGHHHVSYLAESLRAGDAVVMERYARWLQQVLTTRGMCTRHIVECFDLLGRAINPELETLAAYLADAIALARPGVLADHAAWYSGFLERQGQPPGACATLIEQLRAGALRELPDHRADLSPMLDAADAAARGRP